ncbi:hypothetical protein D6825_00545 [Candidatus Woesearchaeota archaeon]|nr:MAG: hypothetical protein D6825_00545 [Candidatus Woesearchaeota archaeon]
MRDVHSVTIRVFAKPEEDASKILEGLKALIPFDLEEEKVKIEVDRALGFNERVIQVFTVRLKKASHTNAFLKFLKEKLGRKQCELLYAQKESRFDEDEFAFFIRALKPAWIEKRNLVLTDSGNCYHIRLQLAAYPRKKEVAMERVKKLFKFDNSRS